MVGRSPGQRRDGRRKISRRADGARPLPSTEASSGLQIALAGKPGDRHQRHESSRPTDTLLSLGKEEIMTYEAA